jgi:transposase
MTFDFKNINPHFDGKAGLIAGLSQQIGLDRIFDNALEKHNGRAPEIPYGSLAQLMLINMADEHHPLSRLSEYFEKVDVESLLNHSVDIEKLNDDRFGLFLDGMHEYGSNKILSEIALASFNRYGIKLTNVNFDTTSKIMWGEYLTEDGKEESIEITFGYSKQKRFDKKQLMLSLGTTQGICLDGQVLSGNTNDKRFNISNLERAKKLKDQFKRSSDDFFYIADSAAFTEEFLTKARNMSIDVITRMPDNTLIAKEAIQRVYNQLDKLPEFQIETQAKPSIYRIMESECIYKDVPLKMACCYSKKLENTKRKTILKRVDKEYIKTRELFEKLNKRIFACEDDAMIEIAKFEKSTLSKLKYHIAKLEITSETKRPVGRPSKTQDPNKLKTVYRIEFVLECLKDVIEASIVKACTFIIVSTKLDMSAEAILNEYKTQSAVERKFQFLKSPQFVNSLYVNSIKRVESIGYLMIILMILLSVAEFVVRRELKKENDQIIGPGKVKMKRPSLIAIYRIFYSVETVSIVVDGLKQRGFTKDLALNVKTVLRHLQIPETIYVRGSS